MQLPAHILSSAETNALEATEFVEWCAQTGMSALEASNALARQIASDYIDGQLDYVFCDRVINSIMNAVTTDEFFSISDRTVPEHVKLVYLAFDAGEYVHPGDAPTDNQEQKYTRPMILSFLESAREA
jgi:hypothetical protein